MNQPTNQLSLSLSLSLSISLSLQYKKFSKWFLKHNKSPNPPDFVDLRKDNWLSQIPRECL